MDDDERAGFERHLATCADCGTEVSDLREPVTKLSVYVATPLLAGLKPKVITVIEQSRQRPPVRRTEVAASNRPRIARRFLALAAAFVAIAGSGAIALDQRRENTATTAISTRAATILAQADAHTVHGGVIGGGQATVVLSSQQDAAVVVIRDLKPLPGGKIYQLWLIDAGRTRAPSA